MSSWPGGWRPRRCALIPAYFLISTVQPIPWGLAAEGRYVASKSGYTSNELALDEGIVDSGRGHRCRRFKAGTIRKRAGRFRTSIACTWARAANVTVAVTESSQYNHNRSFHGGGKVQASTDPADMRLQRMLGHIPALVHPNPKSVLVVACGAGVTAGSFVPHPEVEEIVICDIEPLVPERRDAVFRQGELQRRRPICGRQGDGQEVY